MHFHVELDRVQDNSYRGLKTASSLALLMVILGGYDLALGQTNEPPLENPVQPAAAYQPTPFIAPRINVAGDSMPNTSPSSVSSERSATPTRRPRSDLTASKSFLSGDRVLGQESGPLATTDSGNLLKKSKSALSVGVQSKTPVVSDPRVRGSRVGSLAASGSHWVPARADLDTMLSKFDSRQISDITIVPGPYSALYGPGFAFTDVQLLSSPRNTDGTFWHGTSSAEYKQNGGQFLGFQSIQYGASNWGVGFDYVNRFGDDYRAGGGRIIPSSYRSQDMSLSIGRDWQNDSLEVNVLRLDQNDVIFPGYVFDINQLETDGFKITHTHFQEDVWDRITTDAWINQTKFNGDSLNANKQEFFPFLGLINYVGTTSVSSLSTGYRQSFSVGELDTDGRQFSIGHDLRFVKQELDEIASGRTLGLPIPFTNRNSPIPESFLANPGLFVDYLENVTDRLQVHAGARADIAASDLTADSSQLQGIGLGQFPASYSNIVGTDDYDRTFGLYSGFLSMQLDWTDSFSTTCSAGYAERPPTLTELYAAQPFLLVLQNGLNNVTGDPQLLKEQLAQLDVACEYSTDGVRTGIRGFYGQGWNYITYENTSVTPIPPLGQVGQTSLRYVNTSLATFVGTEWFGELEPSGPMTPFAILRWVEGTDRTRNGRFATRNGDAFTPSEKFDGLSRGFFSGVSGPEVEPLPSMPPIDTRVGVRFQGKGPSSYWTIEVAARMVASQDRIAASLLESRTPGFTVWDTRMVARSRSIPGLQFAWGVENMFDRSYREHFDYRSFTGASVLQPGMNFYVNSSLSF